MLHRCRCGLLIAAFSYTRFTCIQRVRCVSFIIFCCCCCSLFRFFNSSVSRRLHLFDDVFSERKSEAHTRISNAYSRTRADVKASCRLQKWVCARAFRLCVCVCRWTFECLSIQLFTLDLFFVNSFIKLDQRLLRSGTCWHVAAGVQNFCTCKYDWCAYRNKTDTSA